MDKYEKIDIQAEVGWEYALAILGHELRKRRGHARRLVLEFSTGVSHQDTWVNGEHSSENIPMYFIQEVHNHSPYTIQEKEVSNGKEKC